MLGSRTLWSTLALAALVACTPQETAQVVEEMAPAVDMAAIEAVINQIEADYAAAYNAGDAAGIAALFAADGAQSPPLAPRLDQAGVEAAYTETLAEGMTFNLVIEREDFFTNADGTKVVSWGGFEATMTPEGGEPIVTTGRYGVVNVQQADGTWKIYRHIFNYEVPPPGFGQ